MAHIETVCTSRVSNKTSNHTKKREFSNVDTLLDPRAFSDLGRISPVMTKKLICICLVACRGSSGLYFVFCKVFCKAASYLKGKKLAKSRYYVYLSLSPLPSLFTHHLPPPNPEVDIGVFCQQKTACTSNEEATVPSTN